MEKYLIKNATVVNEGCTFASDVLIANGRIEKIEAQISPSTHVIEISADGLYLIPGAIDDQVHFREPGLTHKAEIYTESRAAVAGGITSFMEMPNVVPQTITQDLLTVKYALGAKKALANYSFYMGATNENLEEVLKTNPRHVCGIKVFMGASTGNMLVDDAKVLDKIFRECPMLIATHCEDEATIRANLAAAVAQYGEEIPIEQHPLIRSREACIKSSALAIELAEIHGTRLHVLHISTKEEAARFSNELPLEKKRITAEACIHHLWFSDEDYARKGSLIKWNPAVKTKADRAGIWQAVLDDRIDVLATDHAPHTLEEKQQVYTRAPSGGPLVQHWVMALLDMVDAGQLDLERMVEKIAHAPAICFNLKERGFIREGYWADLVLIDPNHSHLVDRGNILAKCGWSPFEGHTFQNQIHSTWVSGHLAYHCGVFNENQLGKRLEFVVK